jgi:hypothetical protein
VEALKGEIQQLQQAQQPSPTAAPASGIEADQEICMPSRAASAGGGDQQERNAKRDTKNGPRRQGAEMTLPWQIFAHGDRGISAKPRCAARFLSDLHM